MGETGDKAEKEAEKMKKAFTDVGKKIGTALVVAGTALVAFGVRAARMAMNNEEAMSKFNTIYAESAASVTAWADQTAQAMNRSSRELQSMAADAMALVEPLAATREAAIEMSQGMVVAAQDLASFHNVEVTDALAALRAGLIGSAEPLQRFGIMVTEAALQVYALSQ
jgi:hypothetical protein